MLSGIDLLLCVLTLYVVFVRYPVASASVEYPVLTAPCTFPSPLHSPYRFHTMCTLSPQIYYICDTERLLKYASIQNIVKSFEKYRQVLVVNNSTSLAIVIVRQLTPPANVYEIYHNRKEYGCLFDDECFYYSPERVERLIVDAKFFAQIYASILYRKWFVQKRVCNQAFVLALVIVDGLANDGPKMPLVSIHTGELLLMPALTNIQLETMNGIAQGWPLNLVIADLIDQLGYALREFYILGGKTREFSVPRWAWHMIGVCILLVVTAMAFEWYIVRRKLAFKRNPASKLSHASRSKALMLVDSMSAVKRETADRSQRHFSAKAF